MLLLVGDVQGCCDALERLLAEVDFSPSRHRLLLLGDLVNRGPASLAVLRRLHAMGDSAQCLLGNHDLHLLAVAHGLRPLHRRDTFSDVLDDVGREQWIEWIRTRPLALMQEGWLCVHAGVPPAWDAPATLAAAAELQAVLRSPDLKPFLAQMYGEEPKLWSPSLQGAARWRYIANALTRIRLCGPEGELDMRSKEGPGAAPPGHLPWFDVPGRKSAGTPVAFGHWSTLGLVNRPDLLALDSGCVWGGALSAARVDGGRREIFSVPCAPAQTPGPDH